MWQLSGEGGGDGHEAAASAAVVDGHLLALAEVTGVTVALVAELVEGEAAVHEHSWTGRLHWLHLEVLDLVEGRSLESREPLLFREPRV